MLTASQIKDLFAGKLSNQLAQEYLLELNKQPQTSTLINNLINIIREISNESLIESLIKSFEDVGELIDCCGTGGSGMLRYNTSTSVAFVLAAGGLKVAKSGNRSAKSKSGGFDFLELLDIPVLLPPSQLATMLEKTNLVFLFAPQFYPTFAKLAPIRKAISGPSIFNLIGPLLNPLNPGLRLVGTTNKNYQRAIADYLFSYTENKSAFIISADSGLDDLDPFSNNKILAVNKTSIKEIVIPTSQNKPNSSCLSGTVSENAHLFKEMINNFSSVPQYVQLLVTLNAGAAFQLAGKVNDIETGQKLAADLLQSGQVLAKYEQCRNLYKQYA